MKGTRTLAKGAILLAVGILVGRLMPARDHAGIATGAPDAPERPAKGAVWTCSMHPQIRMDRSGQCPICGMDLTPAAEGGGGDGVVRLGEGARRIASIEVAAVERRKLFHDVRTVGRIDFSEPHVVHVTARFEGRVERLYADFTGVAVAQGDHLVDLYSPDLILAQEELLLAARHLAATAPDSPGRKTAQAAFEAARQKLLLWGITERQIGEVQAAGKARTVLTIHAPIGGTVIEKQVREGMYVGTGDPLYTIADLTTVWLYADIYEYELPWVTIGQDVTVEAEGAPGETFEGTLAFVAPVVDDATRTVRVRVNLANPGRRLKPGMFAKAVIRAALGPDGKRAASALAGKYACPMHPDVFSDGPGDCRICGMPLAQVPGEAMPAAAGIDYVCPMECQPPSAEPGRCAVCKMDLVERRAGDPASPEILAVPVSAVLDTGTRQVVYVESAPGEYRLAVVRPGPRAGDFYPVISGLVEGERVVVRGNFLLDSQSQIEGKPSLLFPAGLGGGTAPPSGHEGHGGHEGR